MKLTIDVLLYHLSRKYEVVCRHAPSGGQELGRIRYYEGPDSDPGFLYLLPKSRRTDPVANDKTDRVSAGTYLCWEEPQMKKPRDTSWILLPVSVSESEIYNFVQSVYDLYDSWEIDSLMNIEKFHDYRTLLQQTWDHFHLPVLLTDNHFHLIATAHGENSAFTLFEQDNAIDQDVVADLISNPRFQHLEEKEGVTLLEMDQNYLIYNFYSDEHYCGRLFMGVEYPDLFSGTRKIMERLAEFVEILLHHYGSFQTASSAQNSLHDFFSRALDNRVPTESELKRLADTTGWRNEDLYLLALFLPEHRLKKELHAPYLISQIEERWQGACAVEYEGNVAMLLNFSLFGGVQKLEDFYQSLAYLVRDGLMIAGCSRIFRGLGELHIYLQQARYAINFGSKTDVTRWYFRFDDYSLHYLLQNGTGVFKPEQVCHPALLLLQEHDQEKQTYYCLTLYTFFLERFNMSQTAKKLYIHRSTLINRMERIEELTHLDLDDYDTRLYLEISFRILKDRENL